MGDIITASANRLLELGVAGIVIIALFALCWTVAKRNRELQQMRVDDAKAELDRERRLHGRRFQPDEEPPTEPKRPKS